MKTKTINIMEPCPCGSGIQYETCCQPLHLGTEKAVSARQLLQARYSAYAAQHIDYIISTHHPETRNTIDKDGVKAWAETSAWLGLEIVNVEATSPEEACIEFIARYSQNGKTYSHQEFSVFKKTEDEWFFFDVKKNPPVKKDNKVGRNDPCPCGSNKKFKKCCGL